jgi:hypothetical protein
MTFILSQYFPFECRSAYKRSVRDSHDTEGSDDDFVVVDSAACKNDMISPKNIVERPIVFSTYSFND